MVIKDYINKHIDKIEDKIYKVINNSKESYNHESKTLDMLYDTFTDACDGGKRLRAILVVLGYEMIAKCENDEIYNAAASYEFFQTGILAHDDIIDKSELRRGKPTICKALGGDHLAMSNTICLGDLGIFLSYKTMTEMNIEPSRLVEAIKYYNETLTNTVIGEMLDVNSPYSASITEDRAMLISYYKTAWYTIIGPLLVGATLAGANQSNIESIKKFGEHLGIAYQIKDDILGIFGDEKEIGKSAVSDIKEKKLTLLYTHVLEHGTKEEIDEFNKYYGDENIELDGVEIVKKIMINTGALDRLTKEIDRLCELANKEIESMTSDEMYKEILESFVIYLASRKK